LECDACWWTGSAQLFGFDWLEGVIVWWSSMEELFLVGLDLRNGRKAIDEDGLFFGLDRQ
jgi:hypothetical protein